MNIKKIVFLLCGLLLAIPVLSVGCNGEIPPATELAASSCVTCHTDKDTLKAVAAPEPEPETSEETTGEG